MRITSKLPASHEASRRSSSAGDGPEGSSIRSLSATGKGHGTERAALAGLIGHEPATIDPVAVLDKMAAEPDKTYPVKLGAKTINASLKDIIYDAPKGEFHHQIR